MQFDAASAECLVFTYAEGVLSALAHDLEIRVTRFVIDIDERTAAIAARFDARSLRVVCAVRDGLESPGDLRSADQRQIEENIARDVLQAERYPEIRFTSSSVRADGSDVLVTGTLALCGRERDIAIRARNQDDRFVAEIRLHKPDFGIRPYSAMLGALRVKADVTVRVSLPLARPGAITLDVTRLHGRA